MRDALDAIRARGAELAVVGNGTVEQARAFREREGLTFPLLTDPSRESYREAGLKRGVLSTFGPLSAVHAVGALRRGFRQKHIEGDPLQLGGAFVFAAGGRELYRYLSREAGDHPDPRDLVRALG